MRNSNWVRIPGRIYEDDYLRLKNNKLEKYISDKLASGCTMFKICESFNKVSPAPDVVEYELGKKYLKDNCTPKRDATLFYYKMTNACNFNCSYCFQKKKKQILNNDLNMDELLNNFDITFSRIGEHRGIGIAFAGGEPTLEPNKIKAVLDRFGERIDFTVMATNGLLLHKNIELYKRLDAIIINKNTFDLSKQYKECGNCYDIFEDASTISKISSKCTLFCILDDSVIKTENDILTYLENARKLRIKRVSFVQDVGEYFGNDNKHKNIFYKLFENMEKSDTYNKVSIKKTNRCFCRKYKYKGVNFEFQGYLTRNPGACQGQSCDKEYMHDIYINTDGKLIVNNEKV